MTITCDWPGSSKESSGLLLLPRPLCCRPAATQIYSIYRRWKSHIWEEGMCSAQDFFSSKFRFIISATVNTHSWIFDVNLLFKVIPHQIPSSQSSGVYRPHSRPTLPKRPCRVHDVLVVCRLLELNTQKPKTLSVYLINIHVGLSSACKTND